MALDSNLICFVSVIEFLLGQGYALSFMNGLGLLWWEKGRTEYLQHRLSGPQTPGLDISFSLPCKCYLTGPARGWRTWMVRGPPV